MQLASDIQRLHYPHVHLWSYGSDFCQTESHPSASTQPHYVHTQVLTGPCHLWCSHRPLCHKTRSKRQNPDMHKNSVLTVFAFFLFFLFISIRHRLEEGQASSWSRRLKFFMCCTRAQDTQSVSHYTLTHFLSVLKVKQERNETRHISGIMSSEPVIKISPDRINQDCDTKKLIALLLTGFLYKVWI